MFSLFLDKEIVRDSKKDELLRGTRGIGFENIIAATKNNQIIELIPHPNQKSYQNQRYLIVDINNYPYVCPCIIEQNKVTLKTIFANRKYKHLLSET